MNTLTYLHNEHTDFPPADQALSDPNGLLAIGGDLQPKRLLTAYYNGIFPWFNDNDPILWWSPDPRAVIEVGQLKISRSLRKYMLKQGWRYTINHAFNEVIQACSAPRPKQAGTWITQDIREAYMTLHQQKHAHSVEVWDEGKLIGGLYGIAVGQIFCGESMFNRANNASKAAMVCLQQHLLAAQFILIDAQIVNPHLTSLGATALSRKDFISQLLNLRDHTRPQHYWQPQEVTLAL